MLPLRAWLAGGLSPGGLVRAARTRRALRLRREAVAQAHATCGAALAIVQAVGGRQIGPLARGTFTAFCVTAV